MRSIDPGNNFDSWRDATKKLLLAGVPPEQIIFEKEQNLFAESKLNEDPVPFGEKTLVKVPAAFLALARNVSCHADPGRWDLLYRILWRITKLGERSLCEIASDPDISRALVFQKNVRREIHKMHAFVRFKLIETDVESGRERYAAWFEPEHWVVEAASPFFRKRFANMDWSILTPKGCASWNGEELVFTEGIARNPLENKDSIEEFWKTYYRSIFNPARLKVKMMTTEMPRKYWKNLPEAELIHELIDNSKNRVRQMHSEELRPAKPAPKNLYLGSLREMSAQKACHGPVQGQNLADLAQSAANCQGCPLWKHATGTVFGEGPPDARIMIVGEQPGDKEDIAGRVFVGPAGNLLDQALRDAGLVRSEIYLTNAVKHFKWTPKDTPRGKIRLHQTPGNNEISACRPWVLAELNRISPDILILLGSTAAKSLLGRKLPILENRGLIDASHLAPKVILTVHPSYLLRSSRKIDDAAYQSFVTDLSMASDASR
ncbi:UdgX family uracil-DNA binding protein [Luteolibacter algae]|uniref:Type-4 uracil-DNA glycosylase n=1 Tax=Luteolibacter algae TaxID=454151 RepID=A0ABW5D9C9_9BACT